jgi:hypothetical protein
VCSNQKQRLPPIQGQGRQGGPEILEVEMTLLIRVRLEASGIGPICILDLSPVVAPT